MGWPAIRYSASRCNRYKFLRIVNVTVLKRFVPIAALANPCFPVLTAGKIQGPEQKSVGHIAVHSDVDRYNLVPSHGTSLAPLCTR